MSEAVIVLMVLRFLWLESGRVLIPAVSIRIIPDAAQARQGLQSFLALVCPRGPSNALRAWRLPRDGVLWGCG